MTFIQDTHTKDCSCTYCETSCSTVKLHWGLNIPESKAWNSWWVVKYWTNRYLRFNLPCLRYFQSTYSRLFSRKLK